MTLFELMVVVLITLILAGLAFLSTSSLLTKTKTSRVFEDQRIVCRAIENYIMDYNAEPPTKTGLTALTHPAAYLGNVPRDPFQKNQGGYLYLAPANNKIACLIISPGPDGDFDLPDPLWRFASLKDVSLDLVPFHHRKTSARAMSNSPQSNTFFPSFKNKITPTEEGILSTYIELGGYHPEKGEDGDIITVVRY